MSGLREFFARKWVRRVSIGLVASLLLIYIAFWALFFNPFEGDYEGRLTAVAPARAILAVHARGLGSRWESYGRTGVSGAWGDSKNVDRFVESEFWRSFPLQEALDTTLAPLSEQGLLTEENVLDLVGEECVVVVQPGFGGELSFGFATRLPFRLKFYEAAFERFGGGFLPEGASLEERPEGHGRRLSGTGGPDIHIGRVRDLLLVASDGGLFDEMAALARGDSTESLVEAGWWDESSVAKGDQFETDELERVQFFANYRELHRTLFGPWMKEFGQGTLGELVRDAYDGLFDSRGLGEISGSIGDPEEDSAAWTLELAGRHDESRFLETWRKAYRTPTILLALDRVIPASAFLVHVSRVDPAEYWDRFLSRQLPADADAWRELEPRLRGSLARRNPGSRPFSWSDFLANWDGEICVFASLVDHAADAAPDEVVPQYSFPALTWVFKMKDSVATKEWLDVALEEHFDLWGFEKERLARRTHEGTQFHEIGIQMLEQESGFGESMRPSAGVIGDLLVLSTHRAALKGIRDIEARRARSLAEDETYRRAFEDAPREANYVFYADFQKGLEAWNRIAGWQANQAYLDWVADDATLAIHDSLPPDEVKRRIAAYKAARRAEVDERIRSLRLLGSLGVRASLTPDFLRARGDVRFVVDGIRR